MDVDDREEHRRPGGREPVEGLLAALESQLREPEGEVTPAAASEQIGANTDHVWVTRQGVDVDRIACASADSPLHRSECAI